MLLAPFRLHRPETLGEALELLATLQDSVVYMGGTELLILMKLGMARPEHLVDCKRISALGELAIHDGRLQIGAAVTHRAVERDPSVAASLPVLAEMTRHVANVRVRNAGTVSGNLCFAEPHSDPATLLLALDGRLEIAGRGGTRTVPVGDFVLGPLQTALEPGELVTRIVVPLPPDGSRTAYRRFAIKERPTVNVAVVLGPAPRVVVGAAGPRPVRVTEAEQLLARGEPDGRRATLAAAAAAVEVHDDADCSAEYKRHLVEVLLDRALDSAR
jgi:carbon-monoxide dehydrogenase medium subunit